MQQLWVSIVEVMISIYSLGFCIAGLEFSQLIKEAGDEP
jgi:hypothetical protein